MRRLALIPLLAGGLVLVVFAGSTSAAKGGGKAKSHDVDLLWKVDSLDTSGGKDVIDLLDSFGPPFGNDKPVTLITPRSEGDEDVRIGTWRLTFDPGEKPKDCRGDFKEKVDIDHTTPTSQTVSYSGTFYIQSCSKGTKFAGVKPQKLGEVDGKTTCTSKTSCRGGLTVTGRIKY